MEQKTLAAQIRTELKKTATKRMREQGMIPAVIYGHSEPLPIAVNAKEFNAAFSTLSENTIVTIDTGNDTRDVLIKDYQEDILKGFLTHIDFFEIERGKTLKTHVPIHTTGTAAGVKEGGLLEVVLHEIEVECLPKDLIEEIVIDVSALNTGDAIHVEELQVPDTVTVLSEPEQVVAHVTVVKTVLETTDEDEEGEEGEVTAGAGAEESASEAE